MNYFLRWYQLKRNNSKEASNIWPYWNESRWIWFEKKVNSNRLLALQRVLSQAAHEAKRGSSFSSWTSLYFYPNRVFASFYLYKHVLFIQTLLIWLYLFFLLTEYRWKLRCSGTCCDKNDLDLAHLHIPEFCMIRFAYNEDKS